jgi:hypothetical protein
MSIAHYSHRASSSSDIGARRISSGMSYSA